MRELTKSTLSAGLAMSLFSMQVLLDAFRRPRDGGPSPAVDDLDAVTQAMVDRSGDVLRETFHVADKVQRELVDLTFQFLTLQPFRPRDGQSTLAGATRQATEGIRRWVDGLREGRDSSCGCSGSAPPRRGARAQSRPADLRTDDWGSLPSQS